MGVSWEGESASKRISIGEKEPRVCIFCEIVAGRAPSTKLAETKEALSIMSLEGHPLVLPKEHITKEEIQDPKSKENLVHASELAWHIAPIVARAYKVYGFNIVSNHGKEAGQEIDHVHIHILPRIEGDNKLRLRKEGEMRPPEELSEIASYIRGRAISSA